MESKLVVFDSIRNFLNTKIMTKMMQRTCKNTFYTTVYVLFDLTAKKKISRNIMNSISYAQMLCTKIKHKLGHRRKICLITGVLLIYFGGNSFSRLKKSLPPPPGKINLYRSRYGSKLRHMTHMSHSSSIIHNSPSSTYAATGGSILLF